MALVRLKLGSLSRPVDPGGERIVEAEDLSDVLRQMRGSYPPDYYTFLVFKNGVKVEEEDERLADGDEVVVIPVFSGG